MHKPPIIPCGGAVPHGGSGRTGAGESALEQLREAADLAVSLEH